MMDKLSDNYIFPLRKGLSDLDFRAKVRCADEGNSARQGSRCEAELDSSARPESIKSAVTCANLLLEYSSDHLCAVHRLLDPDASIPVFAIQTAVRSMLESAALVCWITDLSISPHARVQRTYMIRISGIVEDIKLLEAMGNQHSNVTRYASRLDVVASEAQHYGLQIQRRNSGRIFGTKPTKPGATDIIELCLGLRDEYRLLSGVAHGMPSRLRDMGFQEGDQSKATDMGIPHEKAVAIDQLKMLGHVSAIAFSRAFLGYAGFLGWNPTPVIGWFEEVFDTLLITKDRRFWRSP